MSNFDKITKGVIKPCSRIQNIVSSATGIKDEEEEKENEESNENEKEGEQNQKDKDNDENIEQQEQENEDNKNNQKGINEIKSKEYYYISIFCSWNIEKKLIYEI